MKPIATFIILTFTCTCMAQTGGASLYAATDKRALQLPDSLTHSTTDIAAYISANFMYPMDKARAAYVWVASSIQYDVANMFAINFRETELDKINKALTTRKGICENYAAVFNDICTKAGIRSYITEGYVKLPGYADYPPHAWCAAYIDTGWVLFDPTWGSGYVTKGAFHKKLNNDFFATPPVKMVRTHMPYDPLWELLYYPVNGQEFYDSHTTLNTSKPFFNYVDSLHAYDSESENERIVAAARRVEANGVKNSPTFERLSYLKSTADYNRQMEEVNRQNEALKKNNDMIALYNSASVDFSEGVRNFNAFVDYRNKQFQPLKSDAEIQDMLDQASNKIKSVRIKLLDVREPDANLAQMVGALKKSLYQVEDQIEEQNNFLKEYFSKGHAGRKAMFYQNTFFGVPVK